VGFEAPIRFDTVQARSLVLAAIVCSMSTAGVAHAAPGSAALARAQKSWDDGELDLAERGYQEALDRGGLDRAATLDCWVRIGSARAVLGDRSGALVAFRMALVIDDAFTVPADAGKKATALAESARHQGNRVGELTLSLSVPAETGSGEAFAVNVMLGAAQAAIITRLSLHVKDKTTAKNFDYEEPAATVVHFRVPASMTLPSAELHVRVDALDAHDNQLATAEDRVSVRPTPIAESHPSKDLLRPTHGFWSTAWPYVIGGVLVAAGGAVGGYFLLKPPDRVSIGAPQTN
jgi:hypothetical protein